MSNNLIEERDERTKRRKAFKKKVDKIYNLSYKDDEKMTLSADGVMKLSDKTIRLLDEGAVVGDDFVSFIIKKGTLEKFLNGNNEGLPNIDPAETYSVNLGHQDFATFPFIIGEFKKSDLSLVDIGDERKGLDVDLHLDEESVFVQELRRQPYDIGVSAEFNYRVDWESTFEIGILVIDEVYIFAYGLVGECGNVNSSGLELKGDSLMENTKDVAGIVDEVIETGSENTEELGVEEIDITADTDIDDAEVITEDNEPAEEEVPEEETAEEAPEDSEEAPVEEAEEEDGDEDGGDEAEGEDEEATIVQALKTQIQTLTNRISELEEANAKLKKSNRKLSAKYQTELDKKAKFKEEIKGLSVELLPEEEETPKEEKKVMRRSRDGIGEI